MFSESKKNRVTPRWVPVVSGVVKLEYGLWALKSQAEAAAKEIATITGAATISVARVYYRVERER